QRLCLESAVCARGNGDLVSSIPVDPHRGKACGTRHGLEPTDVDAGVRQRRERGRAETVGTYASNEGCSGSIARGGDCLVGPLATNGLAERWRQHRFTNRGKMRKAKGEVDVD